MAKGTFCTWVWRSYPAFAYCEGRGAWPGSCTDETGQFQKRGTITSPRPPLLRDSTKKSIVFFLKPKPSEGDLVATRGSVADAYFGASPVVASALGIRLGATLADHSTLTSTPPLYLVNRTFLLCWE